MWTNFGDFFDKQGWILDAKMIIDVTFAFVCVASILFRQFWTGSSSMLRLLGNAPWPGFACRGSTVGTDNSALAPWWPIFNFAVDWKEKNELSSDTSLLLHGPLLHDSSSIRTGQTAPPSSSSWTTPLALVLVPPLQGSLHLVQSDQSSTVQSTEPTRNYLHKIKKPGHWSVLQDSSSSKVGQTAPPFSASCTTPLPLVLVPPPQVALQSDHEDQSSTLQSTGGKYCRRR